MKTSSGIFWHGRDIKGIVFDLDGTLTDSIEVYYEVFREATARVGIQVNRKDVLEPMATGALIWDRAIPKHIQNRDKKIEECMRVLPQIYDQAMGRVQLFPGVKGVLRKLKDQSIKMGLVTASWERALRPLRDHSVSHYFEATITYEDGFPRKPSPAATLECLRRMDVYPEHALTIGDSPLDIRSGKESGALTVGVLSGIGSRAKLEAEKPTAIIADVTEIPSVLSLE